MIERRLSRHFSVINLPDGGIVQCGGFLGDPLVYPLGCEPSFLADERELKETPHVVALSPISRIMVSIALPPIIVGTMRHHVKAGE